MKVTAVVQVMPVWAQMKIVVALTGLPTNTVRKLTNEGKVRARKLGSSKVSGCVYRVQDVLDAIEEEFNPPEPFKLLAQDEGCDE